MIKITNKYKASISASPSHVKTFNRASLARYIREATGMGQRAACRAAKLDGQSAIQVGDTVFYRAGRAIFTTEIGLFNSPYFQ